MMACLALLRRLVLRLTTVAACVIALTACTTTGSDFDSSALRFIVPGQTTLAEASRLLNASPTDTYRQMDGSALARWSHKTSVLTDAIYLNQELWLAFGPDGRFEKIEKSVNLPRANMYESGVRVDTPPQAVQVTTSVPTSVPASNPTSSPMPGTTPGTTSGGMYKPAVSYPLSQ